MLLFTHHEYPSPEMLSLSFNKTFTCICRFETDIYCSYFITIYRICYELSLNKIEQKEKFKKFIYENTII